MQVGEVLMFFSQPMWFNVSLDVFSVDFNSHVIDISRKIMIVICWRKFCLVCVLRGVFNFQLFFS